MRIFLGFFLFWIAVPAISEARFEGRQNVRIQVNIQSAGFSNQNTYPYQTTRSSNQTQFLVVMEGLEASISIAKRVPYVQWYQSYLEGEGYIKENIGFMQVGTSLKVKPRVLGNRIEVTLTPEVSYLSRQGRESISMTRLSTTVIVGNGETLEIGRVVQKSEFQNQFYKSESGKAVQISLTPEIVS